LAQARKEDRVNQQNDLAAKRQKVAYYLKIGATVVTATVSVAGCLINPMMAGHAVSSFVSLANTFFDRADAGSNGYVSSVDAGGYVDESYDDSYGDGC
jgi:hypothetical protein